jgi:membrane protease YdiL (CAAX protease family)
MLSAILFMATYLGSLSTGYVLFMGLVGLFFGWSAARTDSIWGVALAHAILKVGLLLVWPMAGG